MINCQIGKFTMLNSGVTLGHDVVIRDFCIINLSVHVAGRVSIGDKTFVGIGADIKGNTSIGKNVVISTFSMIFSDDPDNTSAYGVLAKVVLS
jgi:UDP-3-O-[3-hydroxymyristoyl] glucosamine N-acyltransferase